MPVIAFGETANSFLRDGCRAADRPGLVRRLACRIEIETSALSFADPSQGHFVTASASLKRLRTNVDPSDGVTELPAALRQRWR